MYPSLSATPSLRPEQSGLDEISSLKINLYFL
jgi:hypothetical protein